MSAVKIDLVTYDHTNDEFVLILVEDGPWPHEVSSWRECLSKIQQRIFDSIDVAVDGQLAAKYPDSRGKKVRVQVDSPSGAPARLKALISTVRDYLQANNEYHSAIAESPYIKGFTVALGDELNPLN